MYDYIILLRKVNTKFLGLLNFPLEGRRKGHWKFRGVRLLSEIHEKRLEQLWTGPWGLGDSHTTYRCAYLVPTSNSKSNQSAKCIWPKNVGFINWNTVQNIWHINKHNIAANWFLKVEQYKSTNFHNFQDGAAFCREVYNWTSSIGRRSLNIPSIELKVYNWRS